MILIIDFGSQYTHVLAKNIRSLSVYCEVVSWKISLEEVKKKNPLGIIFSGGPNSVYEEDSPRVHSDIYELGIPILGICYGMQLMAKDLKGEVGRGCREFGYTAVSLYKSSLFQDIVQGDSVSTLLRMSHGDSVMALPEGFTIIGSSEHCPIAAMENSIKKLYGLQFHPEVSETNAIGFDIIKRFVQDICKAETSWGAQKILDVLSKYIKDNVDDNEKVILGLSGGVDSTVTAVLLHKVLGDRLICVLVDTGLLRCNEAQEVKKQLECLGLHLIVEDASEIFFKNLSGKCDPEEKRQVIGKTFIEVFEKIASGMNVQWLAQGTIYSDVIESASGGDASQVIKSHHNVGGLPEKLNLKILEPLKFLFKDEVRALGTSLGLPQSFIERHPFPGPGLGIRILGEVTREYVEIVQKADAIFLDELREAGLYHTVSQAFAVFIPVKSVSVKGDGRHYGYTIALRSIESTNFMTAQWSYLTKECLDKCSYRIVNEISQISRVVYDITDKPPATIEWE